MPRNPSRWRFGLAATAFLVAAGLIPSPAHAEDVTDYAITVDPAAKGAAIDDTMYGVFFEDINRAADGGLYAELAQNRSFEYSTADNGSYTPLTSWTVGGTAQVVNDAGRLNERNRNYLSLGAGSSVTNAGYNTGIRVEQGKKYDFSVWARAESGTTLTVSPQGRRRHARHRTPGGREGRLGQVQGHLHRDPHQQPRPPRRGLDRRRRARRGVAVPA